MKITITSYGSRGDIQPVLALGVYLRERGHEVRFCGAPDFADWIEGFGFPYHPFGERIDELLTDHLEEARRSPRKFIQIIGEMTDRHFAEMSTGLGDPDIVVGGGIQLATPSIVEQRGIPYVYLALSPTILRSPAHPPTGIPWVGTPPWINRLCWSTLLGISRFLMTPPINRGRAAMGLPAIRNGYDYVFPPDKMILCADPDLGPIPADCEGKYPVAGALFLTGQEGPLPAELEAFLAEGPAPFYFGYGSMTLKDAAGATQAILEAVRRVGCRAIFSRGSAGLGQDALGGEGLPANCIAIDSVDHSLLFPRMAGVFLHGGAGTTAAAARAGVPQVPMPHAFDQMYWARRVTELGVSPGAIRGKLTAKKIERALRAIGDDPGYQTRAQALGEKIRARDALAACAAIIEERAGLSPPAN